MPKEADGLLVVTEVSLDNINWSVIVCEEQSQINGTSTVSETKTKCGPYSTQASNNPTITGSGLVGGDLIGGQVSYQQMQVWRDANITLYIRRQNAASGTLSAGELTYTHGQGHVTDVSETAQVGNLITFTFTLTFTGTVHFVAGS